MVMAYYLRNYLGPNNNFIGSPFFSHMNLIIGIKRAPKEVKTEEASPLFSFWLFGRLLWD